MPSQNQHLTEPFGQNLTSTKFCRTEITKVLSTELYQIKKTMIREDVVADHCYDEEHREPSREA